MDLCLVNESIPNRNQVFVRQTLFPSSEEYLALLKQDSILRHQVQSFLFYVVVLLAWLIIRSVVWCHSQVDKKNNLPALANRTHFSYRTDTDNVSDNL